MENEKYYNDPDIVVREEISVLYKLPNNLTPQRIVYTYKYTDIIKDERNNSECKEGPVAENITV